MEMIDKISEVLDNHLGWDNVNEHMHTEKTQIMQQIPSTV